MSLEVKWPERTVVDIPNTWERVEHKGKRRITVTNGTQAFTILSPSKRRDKILAALLAQSVLPVALAPPPPEPPPRPEPKPQPKPEPPPKPQPVIEPEPAPIETESEAEAMFHESISDEPLFYPSADL